jgi:hypothetical protein
MNHGESGVGYQWFMDELIHRQVELQPEIWGYYLHLSELFDHDDRYDWNQQRPAFSDQVPLGARRRRIVQGTAGP